MEEKNRYQTKQKTKLLEYMKSKPGCHMTAADLYAYFRDSGEPMGLTTIYRQLDKLVGMGILQKYIVDIGEPACFVYPDETHEHETEYHCECEKCGKIIHLQCPELTAFAEHMNAEHHFLLDPQRTVFYGLCETCAAGR